MVDQKPVVLMLCTGNSCRSQAAEAQLRLFASDRLEVASAGTGHAVIAELRRQRDEIKDRVRRWLAGPDRASPTRVLVDVT